MPIKVKVYPPKIIEMNLGIEPNGPAHAFFTQQCAEHMDKYIPYREGYLSRRNRTVSTDTIGYHTAYANYMYEGKVMGPNIPIFDESGNIVGWWSKSPKYVTDRDIDYSESRKHAGHEYAGPKWDERMLSAESEELEKEVADYIKKFGGK